MILLNIGHKRKDTFDLWSDDIVHAFTGAQTTVLRSKVVDSDTEPTTVLEVDPHTVPSTATIHFLSVLLSQDCIAIYDTDTGVGRLIGPNAEAWLPFNPAYFQTFDGPLAAHQPVEKTA